MNQPPVTALVIDDSPVHRGTIARMLESSPDVEVLGRAGDGEEGLKKAIALKPDVVTLDLEMPKVDGFAFLRLLMATAPTPVIVVSSYAHKSDVFKALELGAFDFVAKPRRHGPEEAGRMRDELLEKIRAVRLLSKPRISKGTVEGPLVVAVAASTGGPPAIQKLVNAISVEPSICLLVCQHMPAQFTRAFAARLNRPAALLVTEARDGDTVAGGRAFIAPGGRQLLVEANGSGLVLRTRAPGATDAHAPSGDLLFESLGRALGPKALGIVLTGMGSDGAEGARALKRLGGEVWAESEDSAVIHGMPRAAAGTGAVKRVMPLAEIGAALVALARRRR